MSSTSPSPDPAPTATPHGVARAGLISAYSPPALAPPPHLHSPVLLATDGSELATNATRVALAVAQRISAVVEVVAVTDTRGVPIPPPLDLAVGLADAVVGPTVHEVQAASVRTQLAGALHETIDWPVHITIGAPAREITEQARRGLTGLVVVGLRRHGLLGRALHDETALHVMRHASCPVLAVTPALTTLPRRVVVGIDFDPASERAACVALEMVAPGGTLTLAYVPSGLWTTRDDPERRIHDLGVDAAFDALVGDLDVPKHVDVARAVITEPSHRDWPSDRLLDYAEHVGADLVALGGRRHGRVERWLLGSVVAGVVRDGRVSVLMVPPYDG